MISSDIVLYFLIATTVTYLLIRIRDFAAQARSNQIKEEIIRETLRKVVQKRRLDELYGRGEDYENR